MAKQLGRKAIGRSRSERASERWIEQELAGCEFEDERLTKRFEKLFRQLSSGIGQSIPWACQDWSNTKAAYRFFANERVSESAILGGHFRATEKRLMSGVWPILMLHDTTELSFHRKDVAAVGMTTRVPQSKLGGKPQHYDVCGILMHSSLAVTLDGLPLGLTAIKFWSRDKFYGCNQMKKRINPTRISIEEKESYRWLENVRQSTALLEEPQRCVHIGDRESIFTNSSAQPRPSEHIFCFGPAWTDLRETASTPLPQRWPRFEYKACIASRSEIETAILQKLFLKYAIAASACFLPSTKASNTQSFGSPSFMLRNATHRRGVTGWTGS
jgi:Transposase DNA-binding